MGRCCYGEELFGKSRSGSMCWQEGKEPARVEVFSHFQEGRMARARVLGPNRGGFLGALAMYTARYRWRAGYLQRPEPWFAPSIHSSQFSESEVPGTLLLGRKRPGQPQPINPKEVNCSSTGSNSNSSISQDGPLIHPPSFGCS
jgi:hypothetical protein